MRVQILLGPPKVGNKMNWAMQIYARVGEWLKPADCKSAVERLRWFESSLWHQRGELTEWIKVAILKIAGGKPSRGSNPLLPAKRDKIENIDENF